MINNPGATKVHVFSTTESKQTPRGNKKQKKKTDKTLKGFKTNRFEII